jgi:hypothetical protein
LISRGATFDVTGLWGTAANDIWAVGSYGGTEHWDGAKWTAVKTNVTERLEAVWASAQNDVWAVGWGGRILRWRGLGWSIEPSPTTNNLFAIWGRAANDVLIAGDGGQIFHWDGNAWTAEESGAAAHFNDLSDRFHSLGGAGARVWAVGAKGMMLTRRR